MYLPHSQDKDHFHHSPKFIYASTQSIPLSHVLTQAICLPYNNCNLSFLGFLQKESYGMLLFVCLDSFALHNALRFIHVAVSSAVLSFQC